MKRTHFFAFRIPSIACGVHALCLVVAGCSEDPPPATATQSAAIEPHRNRA